jgi:hypothetical protein
MPILAFLTSKIAGPLFGLTTAALAIILSVTWLVDHSEISALHKENTALTVAKNTAQVDGAICRGKVTDQNDALDAFAKAQGDKVIAASQAIALANVQITKLAPTVANILAAKAGPDICASADGVILGSLK